jgi:hypothetical protein
MKTGNIVISFLSWKEARKIRIEFDICFPTWKSPGASTMIKIYVRLNATFWEMHNTELILEFTAFSWQCNNGLASHKDVRYPAKIWHVRMEHMFVSSFRPSGIHWFAWWTIQRCKQFSQCQSKTVWMSLKLGFAQNTLISLSHEWTNNPWNRYDRHLSDEVDGNYGQNEKRDTQRILTSYGISIEIYLM